MLRGQFECQSELLPDHRVAGRNDKKPLFTNVLNKTWKAIVLIAEFAAPADRITGIQSLLSCHNRATILKILLYAVRKWARQKAGLPTAQHPVLGNLSVMESKLYRPATLRARLSVGVALYVVNRTVH